MNIYFLRHGDAGTYATSDSALTTEGIQTINRIASAFQVLGIELDQILSSSLPRAKETADIMQAVLKADTNVLSCRELTPPGDCDDLFMLLKETHRKSVLIVGHEPLLSRMISLLISGNEHSFLTLKKGSVAKVFIAEYTRHIRGSLEWLLPPGVLLKLTEPH